MSELMRLIGLLLALALPSVAHAAVEDIEIAPDAAFVHPQTGIALPAKIGELPRDRLHDFSEGLRNNIGSAYIGPERDTVVSVYIYRPVITDISLTTDVVMDLISTQHTPEKDAKLAPVAFTPAGRDIADLLMITFDVETQGQYPVGGVALIPFDDWLIKVRISSDRYNARTLPALIRETVEQLNLPQPQRSAPAAGRMRACTGTAEYGTAAIVDPGSDGMMAGVLGMTMAQLTLPKDGEDAEKSATPDQWCRDTQAQDSQVYRLNEATDRYVVALSDSAIFSKWAIRWHPFLAN